MARRRTGAQSPSQTEPTLRELAIADTVRRAGGTDEADACRRWGCPNVDELARVIGTAPLPEAP